MAKDVLSDQQIDALKGIQVASSYKYTGYGYYLTVTCPALPADRIVLHGPPVIGRSGDVDAGFVAYIRNGELVLECYTWGAVEVPPDFRDRAVEIFSPPPSYIDFTQSR